MIMGSTINNSKKQKPSDKATSHESLPDRHPPRTVEQKRTAVPHRNVNGVVCLVMGALWACLDPADATGADLPSAQAARTGEPAPSPDAANPPELPEVEVMGPEPRFVAPTGRDRIGRIWAPVLINGKGPYRLVLNTGSNSSAVIARVAESLGLVPDQPVRLHGATGTALVPTVAVERLEFGDLQLDPGRLPVVADVFGGAEGVLGSEGFADKRIFIDFENDAIGIASSRRERLKSGFIRIALQSSDGQAPAVEAMMGRTHARAIIDTGAQQTLGNIALREALLRRVEGGQAKDTIIGVTLDEAEGDRIRVPQVEIGQLKILGLFVTFGDMSIFERLNLTREPALLIGMDALGTLGQLVIDYKLRELQVRTRQSESNRGMPLEAGLDRRAAAIPRLAAIP